MFSVKKLIYTHMASGWGQDVGIVGSGREFRFSLVELTGSWSLHASLSLCPQGPLCPEGWWWWWREEGGGGVVRLCLGLQLLSPGTRTHNRAGKNTFPLM